jgi:hypothetical protein
VPRSRRVGYWGLWFRRVALAGGLLATAVPACGGRSISTEGDDADDEGRPSGGRGGSSGSPEGGRGAVGNTGGTAVGGSSPTGGGTTPAGGSTASGGAAAGAASGGVNTDLECRGIYANMPCASEGKHCPNLACGLARSGRRECNCETNWQCTECDFTNSPFRDRPANIPACSDRVADEAPCEQLNALCGPIASEYCACYLHPNDGLVWHCDSPPSTWQ